MKLVFCGLLVLLCIRSICTTSRGDCEKNLKNIKSDLADFWTTFEQGHDIAFNEVRAVIEICIPVNDAFAKLSSKQNTREAECEVVKFVKFFFEERMKVLNIVSAFLYQCYVLLNQADEFRCANSFICNKEKVCSCSCEAETNQLYCHLQKYFNDLKSAASTVKQNLFTFLDICEKMNELGRNFECLYGANCDGNSCSCGGSKDDKKPVPSSAVKTFINDFGKLLNENFIRFSQIVEICDRISKDIKNWEQRVAKN